jgi:hypothetical protein
MSRSRPPGIRYRKTQLRLTPRRSRHVAVRQRCDCAVAVDAAQSLAVHAAGEAVGRNEQRARLSVGTWRRKSCYAMTAKTGGVAQIAGVLSARGLRCNEHCRHRDCPQSKLAGMHDVAPSVDEERAARGAARSVITFRKSATRLRSVKNQNIRPRVTSTPAAATQPKSVRRSLAVSFRACDRSPGISDPPPSAPRRLPDSRGNTHRLCRSAAHRWV